MSTIEKLYKNGIRFDFVELTSIALRYGIVKLSFFGSSVRTDNPAPNDIDLLVVFDSQATISLFDIMDLEAELAALFNLPVDLVEPDALTNPIRRKNILSSVEPLYAA